jgi:two-component system, chemotaxis family, chemotaxis protein CheY
MSKIKILYIEDYPVVQKLFSDELRNHNFRVDTASDGNEALDKATHGSYDLMLVDMVLPVMTGEEFLKAYQKSKPAKQTKIVMFSDFDHTPETRSKLRELGVDDFWIKVDNEPHSLIDKINKLFASK